MDSRHNESTAGQQLACQPVLDAIDQMDTGLELPPHALKAAKEHRQYYNDHLKQMREAREERRNMRHGGSDLAAEDAEVQADFAALARLGSLK